MLMLKKIAIFVFILVSSVAFAGSMGPICMSGDVTVPSAKTAWNFGAQALYLKSSYSGLGYLDSTIVYDVNGQSNVENYRRMPEKWSWGFRLEGSYRFNTGNDFNLNWYHFDHTSSKSYPDIPAVKDSQGATIALEVTNLSRSALTRWDAVNLEFGQHAQFGEWKTIRFHGGVQFADIVDYLTGDTTLPAQTIFISVPNVVIPFPIPFQALVVTHNLKFKGFGPRIGADYWYNWGNGFALYAKGASALLAGTQNFTTVTNFTPDGFFTSMSKSGALAAVVPELEAKLGVTYTHATPHGDLSLDLGWMWVNYFNALHDGGSFPANTGSGAISKGTTTQSNFAVQGPFIGLKWVGNVA